MTTQCKVAVDLLLNQKKDVTGTTHEIQTKSTDQLILLYRCRLLLCDYATCYYEVGKLGQKV